MKKVKVIGAGLAGCEAAWQLAKRGIAIELIEAKPKNKSPAHSMDDFCELVCSNSLKSLELATAHGLLKAELELLDCFVLEQAKKCAVGAGSALAVDRNLFAKTVTEAIKANPKITVVNKTIDKIPLNEPCIIATGPLTLGNLANEIKEIFEGNLSFYDAAAPIIAHDSIDFNSAFIADRYDKGAGDYINCPLEKDEYYELVEALLTAERAPLKEFEKETLTTPVGDAVLGVPQNAKDIVSAPVGAATGRPQSIPVFEGCIPVEVLVSRGRDTLRFGPLKPVGIVDPKTNRRPYAVVQLRKENANGTMYNMVGFQTNLKFLEQKRVFGLIPALKNAEFLRYGVMHRNTYVNAPNVLNTNFSTKKYPNICIAGQLSGVEGYMESVASGLVAGMYMADFISSCAQNDNLQMTTDDLLNNLNKDKNQQISKNKINNLSIVNRQSSLTSLTFPPTTMLGALTTYITTPNKNFQPMNANFGLLTPLENTPRFKDKQDKKLALANRAINALKQFALS